MLTDTAEMASTFTQRQLYGGAIVADLPASFIDASELRQIPDHQEVFLSQDTLTSVIFEVNEYQNTTAIDVHSNMRRDDSHPPSEHEAASTYHFLDPVTAPDTVDPDSITRKPPQIKLLQSSVTDFPAYTQSGIIVAPELDRSTRSALPTDWQETPPTRSTSTKVFQLLIRMKDHDTDLVVRVNVPLKEFEGDAERGASESAFGEQIIEHIALSLDIKDFGLFGGQ